MVKIAPSILNADFACLREQLQLLVEGGADYIHLDVMDGHFVPNMTFGPMIVETVRKCIDLPLDVHLMIQDPDRVINDYRNAGADILTVHVETCPHLWRTCDQIREQGAKVGVTLNPSTPIQHLDPILPVVDWVLVMSVEPGYGGQSFLPVALGKLGHLAERKRQENLHYVIEVDGGIDEKTLAPVVHSGAEVLVIGSAIFRSRDVADQLRAFRQTANEM
ncbi:ribulose-phosphate 3-epimerase [candidate division KSB1 bacterium]|nr:ribulose-phosphate 3-epimerase [candidate division KSB1 bacterium]